MATSWPESMQCWLLSENIAKGTHPWSWSREASVVVFVLRTLGSQGSTKEKQIAVLSVGKIGCFCFGFPLTLRRPASSVKLARGVSSVAVSPGRR